MPSVNLPKSQNTTKRLSKCIKIAKNLQNNKKYPKNYAKSFDKKFCVKYNENKNFR